MSDNSEIGPPLFALGQVVATPAALSAIAELGLSPIELIHRHVTGDWSELAAEDQRTNALALHTGARLISSYRLSLAKKVWIITEANRSSTTILLPEEY